jgi:hypothetical protein
MKSDYQISIGGCKRLRRCDGQAVSLGEFAERDLDAWRDDGLCKEASA